MEGPPPTPTPPGVPIASRRHPLAVRIRRIMRRPLQARREGLFLLDGRHLIEEALRAAWTPEIVLTSPRLARSPSGIALARQMEARGWPVRAASDEVLDALAATRSPQGVLALLARPPRPALPDPAPDAPAVLALVLAGVQDPVNLGVLARAARVFDCPALVTLEETVDPYHPRAVRASAGALLHLHVVPDLGEPRFRDWIERSRLPLIGLVPRGGHPPERARPDEGRTRVLLLGSEGQGLPPALEAFCSERWSIPMTVGVDSLGVAAAGSIALYAATRVRGGQG